MRTWSPAQLLLLAAFLLVPLLNLLLTLWRRRQRDGTRAGPFDPVSPQPPPALETQAGRAGTSGDRPRRDTPRVPAEAPLGAPRLKVAGRLGPRDARRGVVLMTILGPCRALDPQPPPALEARAPVAPSPVDR
jgi:hypothetical protein